MMVLRFLCVLGLIGLFGCSDNNSQRSNLINLEVELEIIPEGSNSYSITWKDTLGKGKDYSLRNRPYELTCLFIDSKDTVGYYNGCSSPSNYTYVSTQDSVVTVYFQMELNFFTDAFTTEERKVIYENRNEIRFEPIKINIQKNLRKPFNIILIEKEKIVRNSSPYKAPISDSSTKEIIEQKTTIESIDITDKPDSTELIAFWDAVVKPIINKDNKRILSTIQVPVIGDWPFMVGLNKEDSKLTLDDFKNNYKKLFNKDFIKILSEKNYKDLDVTLYKDTAYYSFWVGRDDIDGEFEGSVRFLYAKEKDANKFILSSIMGAGGNFYEYKEKK